MAFILSFCCLPVLSFASQVPDNFPTQIPYSAGIKTMIFYREMNDSVIESKEESAVTPILGFTNGSDVVSPLLLSDATIMKMEFFFEFNDSKFVDGQTYNFSFSLDISDPSFYCCIPLYSVDNYVTALIAMDAAVDSFNIGDAYSPISLFRRAKGNIESNIRDNYFLIDQFEGISNISVNFTIDPGYSSSFLASGDIPTIYIPFFLCFSDPTLNHITLHDVTFSPVGATKQLYSDEVFQNSILNGFQDLEDQMSDVNENLDDIEGILNGEGETYAPLPEESYFNEYHKAESEYNKDFSGELGDLIGDADGIFDSVNGSSAFSFITSIFDDIIVSNSKINGLILFCLSLGLCVLILGRRINSG